MNLFDELRPWADVVFDQVPGLELFDAHTHLGQNDPDGMKQTGEELVTALELASARGAFAFPFHEPDGYAAANDAVLAAARDADGLLVPFCRVNPHDSPVPEAERSLAAGAKGIKLHPRAEQFTLDHPQVRSIVALANERSLPVLIHAGRGIPALGLDAVELAEEFPDVRLILAHAGICDLSWIWRVAGDLPNLLFDTAWWIPADLEALFTLVPPGQIVFASDAPYGNTFISAAFQLRWALQLGMSHDQIRSIASGQSLRIAAGEPLRPAGPADRRARASSASAARPGRRSSCCSARSARCGASTRPKCSRSRGSRATCPTRSTTRLCSRRSARCSTATTRTRRSTPTSAGA